VCGGITQKIQKRSNKNPKKSSFSKEKKLISIAGHRHRDRCRRHRYSGIQHLSPVLCCTHGVSIFIDYCTALAIQRKSGRNTGLINRTRSASVQPGATWRLMACARRGVLIRAPPCPPPPHPPPPNRIIARSWLPR
jgi:hypothetical protein